jgi:tetratricopeptide (TPR) repeat protein
MAALTASGHEAVASEHSLRSAVREHLASRKLPVVERIKNFAATHKKNDPGADLAQYISFALASGEPPDFKPVFYGTEIPPDVDALEGFLPLMIQFHQEAGIDDLWRKVEPEYQKELERYHAPVSRALLEVNGYLRNPTSGYMGRQFFVFVDLLAPPNQVHTRSYKDNYYIVVTPSAAPRLADIRHAYLHYLLDPLATKYAERIEKRRSLIDFANGAPALDPSYKSDFLLLTTESLIRAIESRLNKDPSLAQTSLAEGFILTAFFAEQLPLYEKQQTAMRLHFPQMIDAIDVKKETKRLDSVRFAQSAPVRAVEAKSLLAPAPKMASDGAIEDAERLYAARDLEPARRKFLDILQKGGGPALHARAYFGLARIAILQKDPSLAEQLFRKTLEMSPDPYTWSWSEIYLGRLNENTATPEAAMEHYQAALGIDGAPPGAMQAAEEGIRRLKPKN